MKNDSTLKKGSLSLEQCKAKAEKLISEYEICLFIVDIKKSSSGSVSVRENKYNSLISFTEEANLRFDSSFPENNLAVDGRVEKGFSKFLGDATWAGVDKVETIQQLVDYKNVNFPELELYYGVAKNGYSEGIELVK